MTRRRLMLAGALVAGAAAFFGSGMLVANATMGSSEAPAQARPTPSPVPPGGAVAILPGTGPQAGTPGAILPGKGGAGVATDDAARSGPWMAQCPGDLSGSLRGGVLDLNAGGFRAALLGTNFRLAGLGLNSWGTCDENGTASEPRVSMDSSWLYLPGGLQVWVSQRQEPQQHANVEYEGSASFWHGGFSFSVGVQYAIMADGQREGSTGASSPSGLKAAVDAAIADLAPGLDRQCFYRQRQGAWSDLAALGIGDPRPAIPAGYAEAGISLQTFVAPPASCNQPSLDQVGGSSFSAQFAAGDRAFLSIAAYTTGEGGVPYPGQLNDYGVSWSNGKIQFEVWAKSDQPLGKEAIVAIARALDPAFSEECLVRTRELRADELSALGLRAPNAPAGYAVVSSSLAANEIGSGCKSPAPGFEATYNLAWTLAAEDRTVVEVYVNRWEGAGKPEQPGGYRSDYGLNWTDARGTNYGIHGSGPGPGGQPPMDVLIEIARSLDPTLDVDALQREATGETPPPVKPPERP